MNTQNDPWDLGDAKRLRSTEELKEGAFCEYVCEVLQAMPIQYGKSRVLVVTDYTENPHLPYFNHHKATTPQGRRSLRVSLWDDHAFLSTDLGVEQGHLLLLKNVVPKYPRMSQIIEVVMHGTRSYQRVKPKRSVVILDEQHQLVRELLNRKAIYENSLRGDAINGYHSIAPGIGVATSTPSATTIPTTTTARALLETASTPAASSVHRASASFSAPVSTQAPALAPVSIQATATGAAPGPAQVSEPESSETSLTPASPSFFSQDVSEPILDRTFPPPSPVAEGEAASFTSMASQEECASEFISPPAVTPEAHRRLSSSIKRESLSPLLNNTNRGPVNEPPPPHQPAQQHQLEQHANDSLERELPTVPLQQEPRPMVVEKPKQLNKIRIRGRVRDWNPGRIKQFLQCRCSACSTIISPITAKPQCPQRAQGCVGEPTMRYEFSLVVVDEFNQTLTIQVPSNIAAAKMGMADPCNWTNKQNRYEDACKALAKFGIFDKTPNGMMTNGNFARASFVELDMVVALVRPPPLTLPALPPSPTQPLPATSVTLPLTNASAATAQASRSTTEALPSSAGVGDNRWSMTKKVLFQHDVPRVKRQRSEETSFPTMNSTTATSPSSSSDSAIENIMELVSIQLVTSPPTPQPATPQQQHRHPSIPPPPSRSREPTPRHHTPKPPDRFR